MPKKPIKEPVEANARFQRRKQKSKKLAIVLRSQMAKTDLTVRDLESRTGLNYEHLRRIILGEAHPTDDELASICQIVDAPAAKLQLFSIEDRIYNDYGVMVSLEADGNAKLIDLAPEVALIARDWRALTHDQQVSFMVQIQAVADHNWKSKSKASK
jgi:transcriptional regulator with XRE-family HTH domain